MDIKAVCSRQASLLRNAEEEIASLKKALEVERAATRRARDRASSLAGELDALRCRHGYPDPGDYDGQPDESQEPDC